MEVFRIPKTDKFTVVSNEHIFDHELSNKAKGLMTILLALPDDWDFNISGIATLSKDGKDSIVAQLKELEKVGYISKKRARNKKGQVGVMEYTVYESKSLNNKRKKTVTEKPVLEKPVLEKPVLEKPVLEKPVLEKPVAENPPQLNTNISNTNKSNTNKSICHDDEDANAGFLNCQLVAQQISYESVLEQLAFQEKHPKEHKLISCSKEFYDTVFELMCEVMNSPQRSMKIEGAEVPISRVREEIMKNDEDTICYVYDCIMKRDRQSEPIKNMKGYIITALYNAPKIMQSQIEYEVLKMCGG